ncbi:hypothetical protein SKAU_G00281320 [Synaphobranchus kaupii]|uniref:Uncharacterized protein n=1 Tax=Synaphobranchus kaupii TaxID=118154 RepID=A0A9Q1EX42_SYNKA|nr:hypothetical protein SKAU_G00281320 [Synaphobranchus kaupii]
MMIVANTVFKDEKHGPEVISALSDVQLGASTMARRVTTMSENLTEQLDRDLATCKWFSVQCDESVDNTSTAQLMIFIRMVFDDFSTKEELLTLLPLKTTTRGIDIYNAVKSYFVEKKVPLEKLVSVTTDGAPAMTGRHAGFIAQCKGDPDFPKFLNYHCIIHQQALCAKVTGFDHVMNPVVKIINGIRSKAKQHRMFKVLLEELSAEYGDLLLHTEIRWLSRGRILQRFLSLLGEIKEFMQSKGEDASLLEDTEWTLDLAFLTDITEKLNYLNRELQDYAIYKNCLAKVKYNGNTTNMRSHLFRHHPDLASEEKTAGSQPTIDSVFKAKLPFASPRAASITKSIAGFICKDLRPYSVVENEGFRRMLTTLEPRYEVPSRRYFTDKAIPALYAETRAKVEDALQSAERVALTCDGWTSRATESYVTITAHFIDNNWELQSYVLQTRVMHESHTGAHMAEVLEKATVEWKRASSSY